MDPDDPRRQQILDFLRPQVIGDDMTSQLIRRLADDVEAGGDSVRSLEPIAHLTWAEAAALRVMGAAHRLALAGDAPEYAAHLPSCGGDGDVEAAWPALRELCA